jgi:hypothetical protein
MVTEGLPVSCINCFEDSQLSEQSKFARGSIGSPDDFLNIRGVASRTASSASEGDLEPQEPAQTVPQTEMSTQTHQISFSSTAIDTPPQSPRVAAIQIERIGHHRRDSSFRKTYDENDKARAIPCENCALTLPKKVKEQSPNIDSRGSNKNGKVENRSPILRTRKPYLRIAMSTSESYQRSTPSDSDESERDRPQSTRLLKRIGTSSSNSSFASSTSMAHNHYLDYTSTHEPLSSNSFSNLRTSCLRTLSCETLPPNNSTTLPNTPTSPISWQSNRSFPIPSSSLTSTSGGPIFFGDPKAGYTTAYIFRIPDPYARGRRRVYALICLSSAHERVAMRAFPFISKALRDLAAWIQNLAETEADRVDCVSPNQENTLYSANASAGTLHPRSGSMAAPASRPLDGASDLDKARKNASTPPRTSAFLSGRTCDPDGFQRRGMTGQPRSRGLAELVGRPDFFIELHAKFVALLAQLSMLFAGAGVGP